MVESSQQVNTDTTPLLKAAPGEIEVKLTNLVEKLEDSFTNRNKYQIIFDATEECDCGMYFKYNGRMCELSPIILGISLEKKTIAEGVEELRKGLVQAMKRGQTYVINLGSHTDLKQFIDPVNFPLDKILSEEWKTTELYRLVVRESEDVDNMGNKKCYMMDQKFGIIIMRHLTIEEAANDKRAEFLAQIPRIEKFDIMFVTKEGSLEDQRLEQIKLEQARINAANRQNTSCQPDYLAIYAQYSKTIPKTQLPETNQYSGYGDQYQHKYY